MTAAEKRELQAVADRLADVDRRLARIIEQLESRKRGKGTNDA